MNYTPLALIAELTHRCPLHCVYCSNPLEMQARENEVSTDVWKRVIDEAAQLGVLQLHLTGGEPMARDDVFELVRYGREKKLYVNLITSGVGLTEEKLKKLCEAGLDHLQLSFQDSVETTANEFSGTKSHLLKIKAAKMIRTFPLAFTMNIVIHRRNIDRLEDMIKMGEEIGADRLEIAHVQYYGWAFKNRSFLIPTPEQVNKANQVIKAAIDRLQDKIRIDFVLPDYYAKFPKPCMGGWGQKSLLIDPAGRVMPCHSAMVIPGMEFENVKEKSLTEIWQKSAAFERFRGDEWMQEPCRSCDRKSIDGGGCRCQAFLLAGDANATDPVCSLSPLKENLRTDVKNLVAQPLPADGEIDWEYRRLKSEK
jgi:pyrroloquinoline quinone biosynthesis protein E